MNTTPSTLPGFLHWGKSTSPVVEPAKQADSHPRLQYAGFWRRLAAVILDGALVLTLTAPLLFIIYGHGYFKWLFTSFDILSIYGAWDLILARILPVVGIIICWQTMGATPGKLLMSCRIVDTNTLHPPNNLKAMTRLACYFASSLPLNLGFFWIGWDKKKQGFHDKMAKTLVLYTPHDYAEQSLYDLMDEVQ
ncbi:MAG: RDD family protein [Gammaproteobacteria bacterium]|nr:RDD family protein [Gammaproteobacteria bacterium]